MARQIRDLLMLDEMHLMLSARPPHREPPLASVEHRWAMLRLALERESALQADEREVRRPGPSYSYDSVQELRAENGEHCRLALCMGWDSLHSLPTWYRWQELLQAVCIVAVNRPESPAAASALPEALQERLVDEARGRALEPGSLVALRVEPVDLSSTRIRALLQAGEQPDSNLLDPAVADYIHQKGLYKTHD